MDWDKLVQSSKGISADSREDLRGKIFVAYPGVAVDGHTYIPKAIEAGAIAVAGEQDLQLSVPYFKVPNARLAWSQLVGSWYHHPERQLKLIGVTGTDGKTTTCHLIYQLLKAAGVKVGVVSTVAAHIGDQILDTGFHVTSPDPDDLWQILRKAADEHLEYLILEVTSHALDQDRFGDINFGVGVLTNITHEHLDYHHTFENYRLAKLKLFLHCDVAVLNRDDPAFDFFAGEMKQRHKQVLSYPKTDLKVTNPALAGDYNRYNVAAAQTVATYLKIPTPLIAEVVQHFVGVPGRREVIELGQTFEAIIDFAHTPNSLEQLLHQLRVELPTSKRLILVFGSAGLRDKAKRPLMGAIARELADIAIVTAEDPRTELLGDIFAQISQDTPGFIRIDDRQQAINQAVSLAKPGDILVVTGKGHEQSLCIGQIEYPWSDRQALERAITSVV